MKLKGSIILTTIILFASVIYSQDFKLPANIKLENKNDYKRYEPDILKCISYLENTSINDTSEKKEVAKAFLLKWLTGSPNVNIKLHLFIMDFCEKNREFLTIFMAGWTKYTLENNNDTDELNGSLAGLRSIIKVYEKGSGVKKDNNVEKLIQLEKKGNLKEWLKKEIKSSDPATKIIK